MAVPLSTGLAAQDALKGGPGDPTSTNAAPSDSASSSIASATSRGVARAASGGSTSSSSAVATSVVAPVATDAQDALARAMRLVAADLVRVEAKLAELLSSPITPIPEVSAHLAFASGKRFRPLVTLLAAQAAACCGTAPALSQPQVTPDTRARDGSSDSTGASAAVITIAAVAELLHTATLLHDDVVDEADFRRGRAAARGPWGNGMVVLTGDYCLARGLSAVAALGSLEAVSSMASAVTLMAEGEVAQLWSAGQIDTSEERYRLIIHRKTAALIAWSASLAGLATPEVSAALERYGTEVGYAFQIADDVIDYRETALESGKDRGQDLREGKLTLPLILACARADDADTAARTSSTLIRDKVAAMLARGPGTAETLADEIIALVCDGGWLERASLVAEQHAARAIEALAALPDSPAKTALADLAWHVARRHR